MTQDTLLKLRAVADFIEQVHFKVTQSQLGITARTDAVQRLQQQPEKGVVFLTMEDETGFSNVIVRAELFDEHRRLLTSAKALIVEGRLTRQKGVVNVYARRFYELNLSTQAPRSHDFH